MEGGEDGGVTGRFEHGGEHPSSGQAVAEQSCRGSLRWRLSVEAVGAEAAVLSWERQARAQRGEQPHSCTHASRTEHVGGERSTTLLSHRQRERLVNNPVIAVYIDGKR